MPVKRTPYNGWEIDPDPKNHDFIEAMMNVVDLFYKPDQVDDFPTLDECRDVCRDFMEDKRLTEQDEHMIGATWAHIERKLGLTPKEY